MAEPKHIMMFLSGVQGKSTVEDTNAAGVEVKADEQGFFDEMLKIARKGQPPAVAKGWYGSIEAKWKTINAAAKFIANCPDYDPSGSKLVIYGYSAGAMNALWLTQGLDDINKSRAADKRISVDLLITVDAAARNETPYVTRHCGDCVKRNINYYQKNLITKKPFGDIRSEGGPNTANNCNPENNYLWNETHGSIYTGTMSQCLSAIRSVVLSCYP